MGNNQRIAIFVVIGVFMVSVFGSAILILSSSDSNSHTSAQEEAVKKAAEQQIAQTQQDAVGQKVAACTPLPSATGTAKTVPKFALPTSDVTELVKTDITVGTGAEAQPGDCIVAYYHGTLTNGTVFDSAYERGTPNKFSLLGVIRGWQEGVPGMKEGGVRLLYIPSDQAYGTSGSPPVIGADADLVFVIELVEVVST